MDYPWNDWAGYLQNLQELDANDRVYYNQILMNIEKTIYVTRHGSTPYNDKDLLQGAIDIPLSPKGEKQGERLAERLKEKSFDVIFHSPLIRAKQTAEIVNRHHQVDLHQIDSFVEMDMGDWEGDNFFQIIEDNPNIYSQWVMDPEAGLPGGESFGQVFRRVKPGVEEILDSPHRNILVVAHAIVNRAFLGQILNMPLLSARRFRMKNCALSKLEVYGTGAGRFIAVDYWNDFSHMNDLL